MKPPAPAATSVQEMIARIEAIFLDVGNTLRFLVKDPAHQHAAKARIAQLVGAPGDPEAFCELLDTRYKQYRTWAFEELREASEAELWLRWLTPDYPPERVTPLAPELTFLYRQTSGRRVVPPDARETIIELHRRGYTLGIISNLITAREIPDWLDAEGLTSYFKSVVLSSVFGRRKPHPSVYQEAARQAGVTPEHAVYIGDNPARDITGTRQAGFGMVILFVSEDGKPKPLTDADLPDLIIYKLSDLLTYFPPRAA